MFFLAFFSISLFSVEEQITISSQQINSLSCILEKSFPLKKSCNAVSWHSSSEQDKLLKINHFFDSLKKIVNQPEKKMYNIVSKKQLDSGLIFERIDEIIKKTRRIKSWNDIIDNFLMEVRIGDNLPDIEFADELEKSISEIKLLFQEDNFYSCLESFNNLEKLILQTEEVGKVRRMLVDEAVNACITFANKCVQKKYYHESIRPFQIAINTNFNCDNFQGVGYVNSVYVASHLQACRDFLEKGKFEESNNFFLDAKKTTEEIINYLCEYQEDRKVSVALDHISKNFIDIAKTFFEHQKVDLAEDALGVSMDIFQTKAIFYSSKSSFKQSCDVLEKESKMLMDYFCKNISDSTFGWRLLEMSLELYKDYLTNSRAYAADNALFFFKQALLEAVTSFVKNSEVSKIIFLDQAFAKINRRPSDLKIFCQEISQLFLSNKEANNDLIETVKEACLCCVEHYLRLGCQNDAEELLKDLVSSFMNHSLIHVYFAKSFAIGAKQALDRFQQLADKQSSVKVGQCYLEQFEAFSNQYCEASPDATSCVDILSILLDLYDEQYQRSGDTVFAQKAAKLSTKIADALQNDSHDEQAIVEARMKSIKKFEDLGDNKSAAAGYIKLAEMFSKNCGEYQTGMKSHNEAMNMYLMASNALIQDLDYESALKMCELAVQCINKSSRACLNVAIFNENFFDLASYVETADEIVALINNICLHFSYCKKKSIPCFFALANVFLQYLDGSLCDADKIDNFLEKLFQKISDTLGNEKCRIERLKTSDIEIIECFLNYLKFCRINKQYNRLGDAIKSFSVCQGQSAFFLDMSIQTIFDIIKDSTSTNSEDLSCAERVKKACFVAVQICQEVGETDRVFQIYLSCAEILKNYGERLMQEHDICFSEHAYEAFFASGEIYEVAGDLEQAIQSYIFASRSIIKHMKFSIIKDFTLNKDCLEKAKNVCLKSGSQPDLFEFYEQALINLGNQPTTNNNYFSFQLNNKKLAIAECFKEEIDQIKKDSMKAFVFCNELAPEIDNADGKAAHIPRELVGVVGEWLGFSQEVQHQS